MKEEGMIEIDKSRAIEKMFDNSILFTTLHYSLPLYFYLSDSLSFLKLMEQMKEIMGEAVREARFFELRANKKDKYPEMIKEYLYSEYKNLSKME